MRRQLSPCEDTTRTHRVPDTKRNTRLATSTQSKQRAIRARTGGQTQQLTRVRCAPHKRTETTRPIECQQLCKHPHVPRDCVKPAADHENRASEHTRKRGGNTTRASPPRWRQTLSPVTQWATTQQQNRQVTDVRQQIAHTTARNTNATKGATTQATTARPHPRATPERDSTRSRR